jgi:hypothetical protein
VSFFAFPEDARWNPDNEAVEFSVSIGEYQGTVRVGRVLFRRLLGHAVSPEACLESYHLHRTRIERAVEAKLRRRELAEDGNVDLTGRDLARIGEGA